MKPKHRKRVLAFVTGASASGKTILVRKLTAAAKQPRLIIDPAGSWGELGIWMPDPWVPVARCLREGFSGSIVFDDADRYLPKRGHADTWGICWTQHRHLGIDAFIVARRVQELPELAWSSADRLFVFRTLPGSPAEKYLHGRGYVPAQVELPRQPLEFLDVDLFSGATVRRRLTPRDIQEFGNPRGE